MNRRTVLAFLLIFLVISGFQYLMRRDAKQQLANAPATIPATEQAFDEPVVRTPDPVDPMDPVADASTSELQTPQTPVSNPSTVDAMLQPVTQDAMEAVVVVTSPYYDLTIAGRGARITSWRDHNHHNDDGQPVELLPQGEESMLYGADAVAFNAADLEIGRLLFSTDAPSRVDATSGTQSVVFRLRTMGDLEIRKTYTFEPDSYEITLELELVAVGPQAATARAMLGLPRQVRFGWNQGIASTEGNDRLEQAAFRSFAKVDDSLEIKKRGGLIKDVDKVHGAYSGAFRFAGIQNKYFTIVGLPEQGLQDPQIATVILSGDQPRNLQTWSVDLPLLPGDGLSDAIASNRLILYIGPQEADRLKAYGIGLEKTMDLGWALFRPLTEATLWIMDQMRRVIPNYGLIIILFSVLTKLAFYPLTRTSTKSMKKMQQLQPKIKAIQEKYKDNQEKQSKATMELYKKEKVNPMAGCLPLLLQMPVFVALYQALAHTIALRNTPFVLWINDLSKPDALFALPFTLPLVGWTDFNVLPILMTATMWIQTRMTPTGQTQGQMAMMNNLMPVMMFFFFYQMPSGLVLYWLVNNLMTIYQTWRIHKTAAPEEGTETA